MSQHITEKKIKQYLKAVPKSTVCNSKGKIKKTFAAIKNCIHPSLFTVALRHTKTTQLSRFNYCQGRQETKYKKNIYYFFSNPKLWIVAFKPTKANPTKT